jgi:hypothetical protein
MTPDQNFRVAAMLEHSATLSAHAHHRLAGYAGRVARALDEGLTPRFQREHREVDQEQLNTSFQAVFERNSRRLAVDLPMHQHGVMSPKQLSEWLNANQTILWAAYGIALRDKLTPSEYAELTCGWRAVVGEP